MGKTISESLFRDWREGLGFTQRQAASALGISRATVQRFDMGLKNPDRPIRLAMLAISEGLSLDENRPQAIRLTVAA